MNLAQYRKNKKKVLGEVNSEDCKTYAIQLLGGVIGGSGRRGGSRKSLSYLVGELADRGLKESLGKSSSRRRRKALDGGRFLAVRKKEVSRVNLSAN